MGISYNVDESKLTLEERENKKKDNFYIITILGKLRYNKNFKNKLNADEKSWLLNNKSKNAQKLRDIVDTAIADEDAFWEVFSTSQLSNFIEDICRLYGKTKNNWRKYQKINNIPKEYDFQNPFTAALKAYKQDENTPVGVDLDGLLDSVSIFVTRSNDEQKNVTSFMFIDKTKEGSVMGLEKYNNAVNSIISLCEHAKPFNEYYYDVYKENEANSNIEDRESE